MTREQMIDAAVLRVMNPETARSALGYVGTPFFAMVANCVRLEFRRIADG